MNYNECFADRDDWCSILLTKDCQNCKFFKTEAEFKEGVARGKERMLELKDEKVRKQVQEELEELKRRKRRCAKLLRSTK